MLRGFEKSLAEFIKANCLFESRERILLAASGGADSTALLHAICSLRDSGILSNTFICAHINHQLRGADADADETFVVKLAGKLGLSAATRKVDVAAFARGNKLSIETAGRQLRNEALMDIARDNNCSVIATAHHKDDNAETILQRLSRGTGFRGLGGIWPLRSFGEDIRFVRPLLAVTRDEIVEYLKKNNLSWRLDHTNADCTYRRNFIRHRLIGELRKNYVGSIAEDLFELSGAVRKFYQSVCCVADEVWTESTDCCAEGISLDLKLFSSQHPAVKVELVRRALVHSGSGERDLTQQHYEKILQLTSGNKSGKKIELPGGFLVEYEYRRLIFSKAGNRASDEQAVESVKINVPGQTRSGDYLIEAAINEADSQKPEQCRVKDDFVEFFDLEKIQQPLFVRSRRAGDKFVPFGSSGEKKVGKFLTAQRLPRKTREEALIVCDSEKIIWLWPIRMCEQAKVTQATKRILRLQITETAES